MLLCVCIDFTEHKDWGHDCAPGVPSQSPQQNLPCPGLCSLMTSELVCMHFEVKGSDP